MSFSTTWNMPTCLSSHLTNRIPGTATTACLLSYYASVCTPLTASSENKLHRMASQWFASEGFIPEAIHHALEASDWDRAADLINDSAVLLLRSGELMTLIGWLKALPDEVIFTRPELCQNYGWALTLTGQLDGANVYLLQAENIARDDETLLGPILVARAYHLRVRGTSRWRSITLDALYPSFRKRMPFHAVWQRSRLACLIGILVIFKNSERAFLEVDRAAQQSGNHYARMTALTYLGNIQAVYGHLHKAAELCQQVIHSGGQSPSVAPAHIELATLYYEWNQLDLASQEAQIGIEQSQRTGNPLILCDGYRIKAIIHQALGDPEAALSTLKKADQLVENHQVSPLARLRIAACHVQIALAQNNLTTAQYWAEQVTQPTGASLFDPCIGITPIYILLARHKKTEATERLNELYDTACQKGCGTGMD